MAKHRRKLAVFLILAVVVLGAHALLNAHFSGRTESISYGFFLPLSFLAALVSARCAMRCAPGMRRSWSLFTLALGFWFAATVMAAYAHFFQHAMPTAATFDDFFYFFYGVPVLLAIASPEDGQFVPLLFWVDGILACAVGYLAYVTIFAAIPFSDVPLQPLTVAHLIWIYDAENLALVLLCSVRLLVTPRGAPDRRFFQILTSFLWVYGVCAGMYNHIVASNSLGDAGIIDGVVDIPFLVLLYTAALAPEPAAADHHPTRRHRSQALFIDNARPVLLAIALVGLATLVARNHFDVAMSVILGAFVLYGLRSAVLQSRFLKSQIDLEVANHRLQEMTLEDGLTGVANRRCFSQRFALEWGRAQRAQLPLSLLLIDIDRFKQLNDTYGHIVGDECLIQVARTLRDVLNRPGDLLARYGGEEFAALLPETDAVGARSVAARLKSTLARCPHIAALDSQVTISIGATTWEPGASATPDQLIRSADRALYQAKQNGRDRAEFQPLMA